jgi:hypothetical protein
MHGGDPRGMIRPAMRGNRGCLQCHAPIAADVRAHTHHDPKAAGSDCYACHMPPTTYGLLAVHPSHRITNPRSVARVAPRDAGGRARSVTPIRTAAWAARETEREYRTGLPIRSRRPIRRSAGPRACARCSAATWCSARWR